LGSTASDRLGNQITIRSIECWVIADGVPDASTAGDYRNQMRLVFGLFKNPRGSGAPTASGINGIMDDRVLTAPQTPYSYEFRDQWTLLKDVSLDLCTFTATPGAVPAYGTIGGGSGHSFSHQRHYTFTFGPGGKAVKFQAAAGSAGDWETNIPFFAYASDSAPLTTHPQLQVYTRMYFDA